MRGLFVGRFQPFHNGHLKAVEYALKKCDELIIMVGSSQKCFQFEDPFTVGERIEMIHETLKARGIRDRCLILSVPDIMNNALWVAHVNSLVPRYEVVYSNNPLTIKLFKDAGKKSEKIPFFDRHKNEGTKIRESMVKNSEWKKLVPPSVVKFSGEVGVVQRLKDIANNCKH